MANRERYQEAIEEPEKNSNTNHWVTSVKLSYSVGKMSLLMALNRARSLVVAILCDVAELCNRNYGGAFALIGLLVPGDRALELLSLRRSLLLKNQG